MNGGENVEAPITAYQRLANLFDRVLSVKGSMMVDHDSFQPAELAHQAMSILGIPEAEHQGYDPDQPARPVEEREPAGLVDIPSMAWQAALEVFRSNEWTVSVRTVCAALRAAQPHMEPVGPYAPTRDGRTINARYEADPGLFEAGYRQGWRERDINGVPRYPDLTKWDGTYGGRGDHPDTVAELKRIRETEFERGRQQGDADRAQREMATDEEMNAPISDQAQKNVREALKSAEEHRHRGYEAGFSGGKIVGAAEREAELLDQGWTPPGAVHELEVTSGPTDYEVWRDALTLANEHGAEGVTQRARWFHQELLNGVDGGANEEDPPDDNDVQAEPRMGTGND